MGGKMLHESSAKLVAVRTVVLQDEKVLLVGHRSTKNDKVWWMAPGGLVNTGESAIHAATREVLEETGLEVEIDRLIYWAEWIWERSHCVELVFLGEVTGGQLAAGNDPELPEDQQIIFEARFFDLDELDEYPVYPEILVTLIREHLEQGFPEGALYLGTHQPDLPR
jgi:ADP-ribose pyrophosphatase YjhB (NUDIX family)